MIANDGKTPLTEQQARALAHWWGGRYEQSIDVKEVPTVCHGVRLTTGRVDMGREKAGGCRWICSLEEAWEIEKQRGFQEACSPDWVG